jgi:hypothetical protein
VSNALTRYANLPFPLLYRRSAENVIAMGVATLRQNTQAAATCAEHALVVLREAIRKNQQNHPHQGSGQSAAAHQAANGQKSIPTAGL